MKIKKVSKGGVKENSSKMNPHKTRRETLPSAAKGIGKMGMNKSKGGKKS